MTTPKQPGAGLAVVELPEQEPFQGTCTGQGAEFGPVVAMAYADGSAEIYATTGRMDADKAEAAGSALIAAARWVRSQGGDPR